jgi:hypothetical protein
MTELTFPKDLAEYRIRSREEPINLLAISLVAFDLDDDKKALVRNQLVDHLMMITGISVVINWKPVRALRMPAFNYFLMLFEEPFVAASSYVDVLIRVNGTDDTRSLMRNDRSDVHVIRAMHRFHDNLSKALAKGDDDAVRKVVDDL